MEKQKAYRLLVDENIYGHQVLSELTLVKSMLNSKDTARKAVTIKGINPAHAKHLIGKVIAQAKSDGGTIESVDFTTQLTDVLIEIKSPKRDIVIFYRTRRAKLKIYTYYLRQQ